MTRRGDTIRIRLLGIALAAAACAVPAPATAHISRGSDWYFWGSTYNNKTPDERDDGRKDPLNVIFFGGSDSAYVSNTADHISNDWRYGSMENRNCKSTQWVIWRDLRGGRDSDKEDTNRMTNCFTTQYHMRGWDDKEHSELTGNHSRHQWMITGFHWEKRTLSGFGGHKPDRDWDTVRVQAVQAMNRHCSYRRWRKHPGARDMYQEYRNSGWIARISFFHVEPDGCDGA
jgi:hypothetical protein